MLSVTGHIVMNANLVLPLAGLLTFLVFLFLVLYWLVICPQLYRHGAKPPTGLMFWRFFRELKAYKDIQGMRGKTLTLYYLMPLLLWFNFFLLLIVLVRALWEKNHTFPE